MIAPLFPGDPKKNDGLFILGALQPKPFVFVYEQPVVEVVHGPSGKPSEEIYLDRCKEDNVPVLERRGGGGTVVLAPGMVVTIVVGPRDRYTALELFAKVQGAIVAVLEKHGIGPVEHKGTSDLAITNRKFLGSSLYLGSNPALYYYQASLMVESDLSILSRYLKHPLKEPEYRQGRKHEEFCTTLKMAGYDLTAQKVCEMFRTELGEYLGKESEPADTDSGSEAVDKFTGYC
ncbi:MAG: hypothetical protein GX089_05930 [Fibrobacter sp.]|jgi:lipoate-protein ligase A|nr:hypothetical protein [Fibrobacter sp.]HON09924.1 hypothetical protein [Chitinispirillaceae bacterium]